MHLSAPITSKSQTLVGFYLLSIRDGTIKEYWRTISLLLLKHWSTHLCHIPTALRQCWDNAPYWLYTIIHLCYQGYQCNQHPWWPSTNMECPQESGIALIRVEKDALVLWRTVTAVSTNRDSWLTADSWLWQRLRRWPNHESAVGGSPVLAAESTTWIKLRVCTPVTNPHSPGAPTFDPSWDPDKYSMLLHFYVLVRCSAFRN